MSVPPDILAALQGGGAPPAGPGPDMGMGGPAGQIPPDIMAALGGGDSMGGPEESAEAPPSITDGTHGGGEDALVMALDALQDAIDAEADQEDIQIMLQCQAKLQQILAKNQSESDSMMGGKLSPRGLRKAL